MKVRRGAAGAGSHRHVAHNVTNNNGRLGLHLVDRRKLFSA
jgi:hypothetical protein